MQRYIEVFEDNKLKCYSMARDIVLVGTGETAHIKVENRTVSKSHIKVVFKGDQCLVTDLGSANGTYINDQRLSPGVETLISSNDYVRLGKDVLITCRPDLESLEAAGTVLKVNTISNIDLNTLLSDQEKTTTIPLKKLKKTNTNDLLKERSKAIEKKSGSKVEPQNAFQKSLYLIPLMVMGLIYWNLKDIDFTDHTENISDGMITTTRKTKRPKKPLLTDLTDIKKLEGFYKCDKPIEKYLCEKIPETKEFGVVQVESNISIMIDGDHYLDLARKSVRSKSNLKDVRKVAVIYFLHQLPGDLDYAILGDKMVNIAFYHSEENQKKELRFYAQIKGDKIKELKSKITKGHFKNLTNIGAVAFNFADSYYQIQ